MQLVEGKRKKKEGAGTPPEQSDEGRKERTSTLKGKKKRPKGKKTTRGERKKKD